jgi:Wax ester synthase-like Acyl-CoA acyltransferase domain
VWVADEAFDIRNHIRAMPLQPGVGDAELLETVERLMAPQLTRSRPLWELWFITGLSRDRLAALLKLHHAVADGLAAVTILSALIVVGVVALVLSSALVNVAPPSATAIAFSGPAPLVTTGTHRWRRRR